MTPERTGAWTVVMAYYNETDYLAATLRSLDAQTLKPFRLILVDNASSDGSATLARAEAGAMRDVEVIHLFAEQPGKIHALAVSSPKRIALLPDVPTVAESGLAGKDFEADQWYGVVAPAGTPADVVVALNQQVNRSLSSQEVKTRLAAEGAEATPATPQAFAQLIAKEIPRWERVVKAARISVD